MAGVEGVFEVPRKDITTRVEHGNTLVVARSSYKVDQTALFAFGFDRFDPEGDILIRLVFLVTFVLSAFILSDGKHANGVL